MNFERLYPIWFILCALAGAIIGSVTGHGAIRGLINGMLAAASPIFLLTAAHLLLRLWRPDLPACRCGHCSSRGYKYIAPTDGPQAGAPRRFQCPQCERVYELAGGRFDERAKDGSTVPYLYHTKWGRWKNTMIEQLPVK